MAYVAPDCWFHKKPIYGEPAAKSDHGGKTQFEWCLHGCFSYFMFRLRDMVMADWSDHPHLMLIIPSSPAVTEYTLTHIFTHSFIKRFCLGGCNASSINGAALCLLLTPYHLPLMRMMSKRRKQTLKQKRCCRWLRTFKWPTTGTGLMPNRVGTEHV